MCGRCPRCTHNLFTHMSPHMSPHFAHNPSFYELDNRTSVSGLTKCVRSCLQDSGIRFSVLQLGQHVNERLLSRLAGLRRETASYPGSMSLEKVRRTRSTASMISLESITHTFVSFTTDASNRIVRNAGEGNGLEAWGRLHSVYDPRRPCDACRSFSKVRTRRVASELRIWDLRWRTGSQKRQYEMFTDRDGRPCQASDDSLVAAMFRLMPKNLGETVMFTNEDGTRASRSCLTGCWPAAARSSRSR